MAKTFPEDSLRKRFLFGSSSQNTQAKPALAGWLHFPARRDAQFEALHYLFGQ
jgi:hypothetical protein